MKTILLIEDDLTIVEALEDTFKFHDFQVLVASDARRGFHLFQREEPEVIVLDIMLPDMDGFEVCKKIRRSDQSVPIIMLTAKSQENDKLLGFELGADDYVTKPFSVKELVARVNAVLKRSESNLPVKERNDKESLEKPVTIGCAEVNFKNFSITRAGIEHPLSPKECEILKLLVEHPNEVIDRNRIIDRVWGDDYFPSPRTIDNFVLKLRNKIEEDPKNPVHIMTVHGAGYKIRFS